MYILLSCNSLNHLFVFPYACSCNVGNSGCTGAIASASIFSVGLVTCVAIFSVVILILVKDKLIGKVDKLKFVRRTARESDYEQPSQSVMSNTNLMKNVAYGQPPQSVKSGATCL